MFKIPAPHWNQIISLRDVMPFENCPTVHDIIAAVSKVTRVGVVDLKSMSRFEHITKARFMVYWVARQITGYGVTEIARWAFGRHHSTIISGCRQVDRNIDIYMPTIRRVVEVLKAKGFAVKSDFSRAPDTGR